MLLYVSAFLMILCIGLSTTDDDGRYPKEGYFSAEKDCSRSGGICVLKELCPDEKKSSSGSCPKQENLGAVCCLSVPKNETRCQKLGGECIKSCHQETLRLPAAKDCPANSVCCVLV